MTGRVVVTGGLGFIGSNLALACRARGAEVTVVDTLHPECGGNRANLRGADIPVIPADIRDPAAMAEQVRGATAVFHCAALTSHAGSMAQPIETTDVNGTGTVNLLEAVRQNAPDAAFVHVGTSTQIGRMRSSPIDEGHPEFPLDIYSASKTAAEKYVLVYGTAHKLRTTVVRLANIYGPRAHIKTPKFGFMGFFVGLALQGKDITVYGDGSQLRSATYVDDAIDALLRAAERADSRGELLFAAAEQQHRLGHLAERMAAVIGGRVKYIEWPEDKRRLEVGDAVISAARARELLGWQATTDLDAGLAATAAYYRDRLEDYL